MVEERAVVDVAQVLGQRLDVRVVGPGLDEQDAHARILADARGDDAAAGAGADDDQVVVVGRGHMRSVQSIRVAQSDAGRFDDQP